MFMITRGRRVLSSVKKSLLKRELQYIIYRIKSRKSKLSFIRSFQEEVFSRGWNNVIILDEQINSLYIEADELVRKIINN